MIQDDVLPVLINDYLFLKGEDENLKEKISKKVEELLMHNTAYLYQILYRIDVREEKVKNVFIDSPLVNVAAERITNLIIERQKEKIQWREMYSKREDR
ncbi:MAG TPA: hypothetical protein VK766_02455 [Cytophagaceae bacterium]|jgi:hypothetical protein|nr:hypothetical protein [Cytophagaceae bacterium]